jgi:hypothetical protein
LKPNVCRLSFNIDQSTHLEAARDAAKIDSGLLSAANAKEGPSDSVTRKLTDDYVRFAVFFLFYFYFLFLCYVR